MNSLKRYFLLITLGLAIVSCQEDNSPTNSNQNMVNEGIPALIMVIDNNDGANQQIESIAFNSYKAETLSIFSEIFGVPEDSLIDKDLNEILDVYGEPWQIKEITAAAKPYYKKIIVLTDEKATGDDLLESLSSLNDEGYTIDVVFSLHGNEKIISFTDRPTMIKNITHEIIERNIKVRLLYQTNCKSANALINWTGIGIMGCNGTVENNYLTIFAPANFIRSWVSGASYFDAVQYAYRTEISTLKSFNDKLPMLDYFIEKGFMEGSKPIVTGNNININKDMYFDFK